MWTLFWVAGCWKSCRVGPHQGGWWLPIGASGSKWGVWRTIIDRTGDFGRRTGDGEISRDSRVVEPRKRGARFGRKSNMSSGKSGAMKWFARSFQRSSKCYSWLQTECLCHTFLRITTCKKFNDENARVNSIFWILSLLKHCWNRYIVYHVWFLNLHEIFKRHL